MSSRIHRLRLPDLSPALCAVIKAQRRTASVMAPKRVYRFGERWAQTLLAAQDDLCADAQECLSMLDLMEALRPYGKPHLVGSVALRLVVRLDIDVHVLVPKSSLPHAALDAASTIFLGRELGIVNVMNFMFCDSMKVTVACRGLAGTWNVDVWLTAKRREFGLAEVRKLKPVLDDEHRKTILSLKHFYNQRNQCRYGMSRYLYRAVLDEGVRTPKQFLRYLRRADVTYPVLVRMLEEDRIEQDPLWHLA